MPMKLEDLSGDTLGQLSEGMFGRVVQSEMIRLTNDLDQRGQDGKTRKLVINLDVYWDADRGKYMIEPSCQAKLPAQKAYSTEAKIEFDPAKKGHTLMFNPDSITADQQSMTTGHE
jgi:hypothetical protein